MTTKKTAVKDYSGNILFVAHVAEDGAVTIDDRVIGYVKRGTRTYSPPTHKGSRIVKYHKQVPEWHGWKTKETFRRPDIARDTRTEVLRWLHKPTW